MSNNALGFDDDTRYDLTIQNNLIIKKKLFTKDNTYIRFFNNNVNEADIRLDSASNLTFANISDIKLKKNIEDYTGGYDKVKQIHSRQFDWTYKDNIEKAKGFIAQEVELYIPELVMELENKTKAVAYTRFIPYLWSATRTIIDNLEELTTKVNKMNAKINQLTARVNQLENYH